MPTPDSVAVIQRLLDEDMFSEDLLFEKDISDVDRCDIS